MEQLPSPVCSVQHFVELCLSPVNRPAFRGPKAVVVVVVAEPLWVCRHHPCESLAPWGWMGLFVCLSALCHRETYSAAA